MTVCRLLIVTGLAAVVVCMLCAVAAAAKPRLSFVGVRADEWNLRLSRGQVKPGRLAVQLVNGGEDDHDLIVRKSTSRTPVKLTRQRPGGITERTFTVTRGRYELFCSLPGHRKAGMSAQLTVR